MGERFAREPGGATKNALDGLAGAYDNLPQYPPLTKAYVVELLHAHDTPHAVQILRRIAYAPHGGSSAEWAQAQLRAIEAARSQTPAASN